jgi:hypothetical protein
MCGRFSRSTTAVPHDALRWIRCCCAIVLLTAAAAACAARRAPAGETRYLVTGAPIQVGEGIDVCIAVDVSDDRGIWWWMPGRTGCGSRSSGPGVFRGEGGSIARSEAGEATAIAFRLGTHSMERPSIDVRLTLEEGTMRGTAPTAVVPLVPRSSLDLPEVPPFGRAPRE